MTQLTLAKDHGKNTQNSDCFWSIILCVIVFTSYWHTRTNSVGWNNESSCQTKLLVEPGFYCLLCFSDVHERIQSDSLSKITRSVISNESKEATLFICGLSWSTRYWFNVFVNFNENWKFATSGSTSMRRQCKSGSTILSNVGSCLGS